jgi:4'-phosphopantetheinyl transferase
MPVIAWPVAGGPVSLSPGAVHVWGWSLNVAPGKVFPGNESALSAEERARADRFVSPIHRARFVASHSGLRQVLSGYLRVKPSAVTFAIGSHGKPVLTSSPDLHFNLSHAEDVALLAVAAVEVGIDVEFIHPVNDNIAERFFAPAEIIALAALPAAEHLVAFYACWTRKEAFLKGLGTGISGGLDSFAVTLPTQGMPRLSDTGSGVTAGWTLEHLEPAAGYIGALAIRARTATVHCFSFTFE